MFFVNVCCCCCCFSFKKGKDPVCLHETSRITLQGTQSDSHDIPTNWATYNCCICLNDIGNWSSNRTCRNTNNHENALVRLIDKNWWIWFSPPGILLSHYVLLTSLPNPLMIPAVKVWSKPYGFPMAMATCPTFRAIEWQKDRKMASIRFCGINQIPWPTSDKRTYFWRPPLILVVRYPDLVLLLSKQQRLFQGRFQQLLPWKRTVGSLD